MATQQSARSSDKIWKWTDDQTLRLIGLRKKNDGAFTGKKGSSIFGWETVAKAMNISGLNEKICKKKWNNLLSKYKECKYPPTGTGTDSGEITPITWKFYDILDEFLSHKDNISPPLILDSSMDTGLGIDVNKYIFIEIADEKSVPPLTSSPDGADNTPTTHFASIASTATATASTASCRPIELKRKSNDGGGDGAKLPSKKKNKNELGKNDDDPYLEYFKQQDKKLDEQNTQMIDIMKDFLAEYKKK